MSSKKPYSRTVTGVGNSSGVTLPPGWMEQNDVEEGDELMMGVGDDGELRFEVAD
jgi:antitoxin component of MazEF toxin-antitoxin module